VLKTTSSTVLIWEAFPFFLLRLTKRKDLEKITKDFYEDLYVHKGISEEAFIKVMEGVPATFTNAMNEALRKEIMEKKLRRTVNSMAEGKAPGHDHMPVEFFQKYNIP
jgi:hypothetical protein